jgi:hypothetical protein
MMLACLLAAVLTPACGGGQTKADSPLENAPDTFELKFDWPVGVDGKFNKFGTTTRGPERTSVEMTYTVRTKPTSSGWSFHYDEARDVRIEGLPDAQKKLVEPLMKLIPSVEFEGAEIVRIVGYEGMVEGLHDMMAPMYEQNPALEAQMRASMTADHFLSSARKEWAWRATAWNGRTLKVGTPVEETTELALGVIPGAATATDRFEITEVLACPGEDDRMCVRLERRVAIGDESLRKVLGEAFAGAEIDEAERYTEVEVIAEPDTLLTYDMKMVEVTRLKMNGGQSLEQRKVSRELYEWDFAKAGEPGEASE